LATDATASSLHFLQQRPSTQNAGRPTTGGQMRFQEIT